MDGGNAVIISLLPELFGFCFQVSDPILKLGVFLHKLAHQLVVSLRLRLYLLVVSDMRFV